MKKIFTFIAIAMVVASCGTARMGSVPSDTKNDYVAYAEATNYDKNTARMTAENECYRQLSFKISAIVKTAMKTYNSTYDMNDKNNLIKDYSSVIEGWTLTISNCELYNITQKVSFAENKWTHQYTAKVTMSIPRTFNAKQVTEDVLKSNIPMEYKEQIKNDRDNFERSLENEWENINNSNSSL